MASKFQLLLGLVVLFHFFQMGESGGQIEILLDRFQSTCKEHAGLEQCDLYFIICIDKQRALDSRTCQYKRKQTNHYHNDNSMDFGDSIQGTENPVVAYTSSFQSNGARDVMFVFEAWDEDTFSGDDHQVTMKFDLSYTPKASNRQAAWKSTYSRSGSNHLWFKYRFYCDPYYYTTKCNVYCKARDDYAGHYTCIEGTGQKKCMTGWTGTNCNVDIDECRAGPCYQNGTCTNLPGTYQCTCPQGFTGKNCDQIDSLCHSTPCQNGGTCTGTLQEYNCTCPVEWEGQNCDSQVDFCESSPCQNGATCYATLGNYTCNCPVGWNGTHCEMEVHACDSSPCKNNGSCTNLPRAKYECTCPAKYKGVDCETLKDPCEPMPCLNSGMCNMVTYDTFECKCVFGWVGKNCQDFLKVRPAPQSDEEGDDKGVDLLPILLAILAAIIIIVAVLVLLFIRRRRRQKKAAQAMQATVVHVARSDNLAFPNALYDETNRANSVVEAQGARRPLPTPTPTACPSDDVFNYTKPKVMEEGQEQGAVGGCNPYQDIDNIPAAGKYVDMEGAVGGGKEKEGEPNPRPLDTRTMAGGNQYDNPRESVGNPYADFNDLKQRSVAQREASGYANAQDNVGQLEEAEENHYHELDEVRLDIQTSGPDPTTPPSIPSSTPHYDVPSSVSSDVTPNGNELSPPGSAVGAGAGYMDMAGSTRRDVQLENLDSSDGEDEEAATQEDIERLRQEVLQGSNSHSNV